GIAGALAEPPAGDPVAVAGRGYPRRARSRVIVVDASTLVEVLLRARDAQAIEDRLFENGQTLHAPHLIDVEVAHAIRRYAISGQIKGDRGRAAFAILAALPLNRYPHGFLLPRIWDLRNNLTAYDAEIGRASCREKC